MSRSSSRIRILAALGFLFLLVTGACRHGRENPPPAPYGYLPPGQWQGPQWGGGSPPPALPSPAPSPTFGWTPGSTAIGVPCAGDADLQCPFGHCIGGRCGGCASTNDCKAGASCAWTPLGNACLLASFPGAFPTPAPAPSPMPAVSGDARQQCVDRTNQYRTRVGVALLARAAAKELCDDQEAQSDALTGTIHGAFGRCGEFAQNECPDWAGTPESMIGPCLQKMFEEGPGEPYEAHGHYVNMTSPKYTQVACGFHAKPDGSVWMVQDFW